MLRLVIALLVFGALAGCKQQSDAELIEEAYARLEMMMGDAVQLYEARVTSADGDRIVCGEVSMPGHGFAHFAYVEASASLYAAEINGPGYDGVRSLCPSQ